PPSAVQASTARQGFVCAFSCPTKAGGALPGWTAEGGCPYVLNACRTNSAAARRTVPAAAYERTACATARPAPRSCCAGKEQYPDPLPREPSPDLRPKSPPSARRRVSPPARSAAAPNLPAEEASRRSRLRQPSRAANPLLPLPTLQSRIPRAPAASLFPAARHCPARIPRSAPPRIQALVELFLPSPHRPPLLSSLPTPPARPASSRPGYSLSLISRDAGRICQKRHLPRGARLPVARRRSSRSQSRPNRASTAAESRRAAVESALRFR